MGRMTLRQRRMRARGINTRLAALWGNRVFMGLGNRATLTTSLAGTNNDLLLYAKTPGTAGNSIRLALVVAGANTPLTVAVSGNDITVNVATNGSSAAISTGADVGRAIRASAAASLLVHAQNAPANDGTGVVAALAFTALSGAV